VLINLADGRAERSEMYGASRAPPAI
jgi:hypothetical protein